MKQQARIRLRFVGNRPRILVAEPYYTPVTIVQTAAGALGAFTSIIGGMATLVSNSILGPLLGLAAVCLVVFIGGELTLVRADSIKGRLSVPSSDISALRCRISHHAYESQGITIEDRFRVSPRPQPPRMVWMCTRCGDEQWLRPGVTPE
jgi:hypothetical protein